MYPEESLWKGREPGSPYTSLPQVPTATCPALRASGEPTVATPAPARMGAPASLRMAIVCVHLDSEVPPARDVRLPPLPPTSSVVKCSVRGQKPPPYPSCFLPLIPILVPVTAVGKREGDSGTKGLLRVGPCPQSPGASFFQPVSLDAMANAVCPASVLTTPPATPRMEHATAWLAGLAQTVPYVRLLPCSWVLTPLDLP